MKLIINHVDSILLGLFFAVFILYAILSFARKNETTFVMMLTKSLVVTLIPVGLVLIYSAIDPEAAKVVIGTMGFQLYLAVGGLGIIYAAVSTLRGRF